MMELLRLLLVDDEKIILKGLEVTYDWASMGFTIAGTASDGIAALEMIETAKPDLVLTDIRMKCMGGLELMEKAQKIAPQVSFVVLSAYRDFEYAQTALRNGALAYLVKPINDEELKETMLSVYEACKDKIFKTESYEKWRQLLLEDKESYLHMMRGRYLNGAISAEDYRHIYKSLKNADIEDENCVVLCADVDLSYKVLSPSDYEAKRYVLLAELEKRLEEVYEMSTYKTPEGSPIFVIRLGNEKNCSRCGGLWQRCPKSLNVKSARRCPIFSMDLKACKRLTSRHCTYLILPWRQAPECLRFQKSFRNKKLRSILWISRIRLFQPCARMMRNS